MISHEGGKDRIVITTNVAYHLSFVTQVLRNGLTSYCGDYKQFRHDDFDLATMNPWFSSYLLSLKVKSILILGCRFLNANHKTEIQIFEFRMLTVDKNIWIL